MRVRNRSHSRKNDNEFVSIGAAKECLSTPLQMDRFLKGSFSHISTAINETNKKNNKILFKVTKWNEKPCANSPTNYAIQFGIGNAFFFFCSSSLSYPIQSINRVTCLRTNFYLIFFCFICIIIVGFVCGTKWMGDTFMIFHFYRCHLRTNWHVNDNQFNASTDTEKAIRMDKRTTKIRINRQSDCRENEKKKRADFGQTKRFKWFRRQQQKKSKISQMEIR